MSVELLTSFSYPLGSMKIAKTKTRVRLGKRIRQLRKEIGLSQEKLGFRSGLHRTYIGAIERAEQNVSIDNIHKIAKALKIPPKELLE